MRPNSPSCTRTSRQPTKNLRRAQPLRGGRVRACPSSIAACVIDRRGCYRDNGGNAGRLAACLTPGHREPRCRQPVGADRARSPGNAADRQDRGADRATGSPGPDARRPVGRSRVGECVPVCRLQPDRVAPRHRCLARPCGTARATRSRRSRRVCSHHPSMPPGQTVCSVLEAVAPSGRTHRHAVAGPAPRHLGQVRDRAARAVFPSCE